VSSLEHLVEGFGSAVSEILKRNIRLNFTTAHRTEASLSWVHDQIKNRPKLLQAIFTVAGVPAPESHLFLQSPDDWLAKHLPSPHRQSEWIAGREALIHCFNASDPTDQLPPSLSLSHSHETIVACGSNDLSPIGIDLERTDRQISERTLQRVFSNEERGLGLTAIELWTIKEATFKALRREAILLPQISVESCEKGKLLTGISGMADDSQKIRYFSKSNAHWTLTLGLSC
jgi:4'-phosphopantetheinyl transferase EntD